jgi:hypothetical protein
MPGEEEGRLGEVLLDAVPEAEVIVVARGLVRAIAKRKSPIGRDNPAEHPRRAILDKRPSRQYAGKI